jgi:Clp amino terminal domain, pathogenicity island component
MVRRVEARMFERYTEPARRVIFYARQEASNYGADTINTEHLLLGLLREDPHLFRVFLSQEKLDELRNDLARRLQARPATSTSVDMPLAPDCNRVLSHASEEAERMRDEEIGTKHLLLGLLHESDSGAAQVLQQVGLKVTDVRVRLAMRRPPAGNHGSNPGGVDVALVVNGTERYRLPFNAFTLPRHGDVLIFGDETFATLAVRFHYDRDSLTVVQIEIVAEELTGSNESAPK